MTATMDIRAETDRAATARLGLIAVTLLAGVVGLQFWELWIRHFAPNVGDFSVNGPVGLARATLNAFFDINVFREAKVTGDSAAWASVRHYAFDNLFLGLLTAKQIAEIAHYGAAFIFYPLGYLLVAQPLKNAVLPAVPYWVVGLVYGALLFVFASYIVHHLVLGRAAFFGWDFTNWASLPSASFIGHVLIGLGIAVTARVLGRA